LAARRPDSPLVNLVTGIADRSDVIAGVENRLREVAKTVRRSMLDAMPDGEPSRWLYGPMREYPSRPGKALRPALCLSAGRVFGATPDDLMGIAVAIELLHNAFLVHDDIADGSEMRRGRPTLAATHGMAAALNAGDGLAIVAGQVLRKATRRLDGDLADLVWHEFDTMAMRTLEGQAIEVGWQLDNVDDLRPDDYLELIMHKTCLVHHHPSAARGRIGGFGG
jgi:geranylgeranyl diphosphate synthase, type II